MDVKNISYNYPSPKVEIWRLVTERKTVTKTEVKKYKTEGKTAEMYLDVWRGWLGWSEGNGKYKQIIDIYNANKPLARGYAVQYDDEWCDTTVSAAAIKAGMVDLIGTECSCGYHEEIFKTKGIWVGKTLNPQPGDLILYAKSGTGWPYHIGVVETNNKNGTITIINGNSGATGKFSGSSVMRWTHSIYYGDILGYARPRYYEGEDREETVTKSETESQVSGVELIHEFSPTKDKALQSYNWNLSKDSVEGGFSLTLYPESIYDSSPEKECLFDVIHKLDVVKIYEASGLYSGKPSFTGIIKRKKYVSQASGSGSSRRVNISGIAITGLVSDFYLNLDTNASILTEQMANNEYLRRDLTISLNTSPGKFLTISSVIKTLWDKFSSLSNAYGTPTVGLYLTEFTKDELFSVNDAEFKYNLGCVFNGNSTQNFFSLVDNIIPNPVYEKFSYTDENGIMHIRIRQVPFPYNKDGALEHDEWDELVKNAHEIKPKQLTSFSVTSSDDEAYTVFFGYLSGYPISEDKALRLSYIEHEGMKDTTLATSDRYSVYGYRPLNAHFIGYGKEADGKEDGSALAGLSAQLKDWYADLPDMLTGDLNIAMSCEDRLIMPGELVHFAGGYFYVDAISHSWNYGSGGTINVSLSRGGLYDNGKFAPFENVTDIENLIGGRKRT
ncbi:MAG: CHAP domain-containing protein [Treponema sp.]|nr:CHAP domain-containing protein [Treponema sp.]